MTHSPDLPAIAFSGSKAIASGRLAEVALVAKAVTAFEGAEPVLVFEAASGKVIDLDYRGTAEEVVARLGEVPPPSAARPAGRPRLGVVAREVTLLPRHWEWLGQQRGGASVALRQLVEAARRQPDPKAELCAAQEAAYRFMAAMAGDYPNYEEAVRALFAPDAERFAGLVKLWPQDVRAHAEKLAGPALAPMA